MVVIVFITLVFVILGCGVQLRNKANRAIQILS